MKRIRVYAAAIALSLFACLFPSVVAAGSVAAPAQARTHTQLCLAARGHMCMYILHRGLNSRVILRPDRNNVHENIYFADNQLRSLGYPNVCIGANARTKRCNTTGTGWQGVVTPSDTWKFYNARDTINDRRHRPWWLTASGIDSGFRVIVSPDWRLLHKWEVCLSDCASPSSAASPLSAAAIQLHPQPAPIHSDCFTGIGIFQQYLKARNRRPAGTYIHWSQVVRCKVLPKDMVGQVCLWKVHSRTTAEDLNCTIPFDESDLRRHRLGHQDGLYWHCPSANWAGNYYAQGDYWGDDPGPYMRNHLDQHQPAMSLCSDVEHFTCNAHHHAVLRRSHVHIHPDTHTCIPRRNVRGR